MEGVTGKGGDLGYTLLVDRRPTRYETRKIPASIGWTGLVRGSELVRGLHY